MKYLKTVTVEKDGKTVYYPHIGYIHYERMGEMSIGKLNRFSALVVIVIVAMALVALPGCSKVKEKAAGAAETALGAVERGAEIAGEATANWLGTTAGNVGKNFNETIVERFSYLEITVDSIDIVEPEVEDEGEGDVEENIDDSGTILYSIELTLNNTAPDSEKLYMNILLGDYYLVACDQDDYTYSLRAGSNSKGYYDQIKPGKSKFTAYTELAEPDRISYLLFIGNRINAP